MKALEQLVGARVIWAGLKEGEILHITLELADGSTIRDVEAEPRQGQLFVRVDGVYVPPEGMCPPEDL